ncbi:hypothetical protein D3C84_1104970 [compost metagenome]
MSTSQEVHYTSVSRQLVGETIQSSSLPYDASMDWNVAVGDRKGIESCHHHQIKDDDGQQSSGNAENSSLAGHDAAALSGFDPHCR